MVTFIEMKSATGVRRRATREYGHSAPSANSLQQRHQILQESGKVGHRPRSWRPGIRDTGVASIEQSFGNIPISVREFPVPSWEFYFQQFKFFYMSNWGYSRTYRFFSTTASRRFSSPDDVCEAYLS